MGIQAMHKNTGFLLDSCDDWIAVEDSSQLHKECSYGFSIKTPLVGKTETQRTTGRNPLYTSSYKPPYPSPNCSTTRCQKNYLERTQSVETRNKKLEEKRKLNWKNWKGNLLKLEMGLGISTWILPNYIIFLTMCLELFKNCWPKLFIFNFYF